MLDQPKQKKIISNKNVDEKESLIISNKKSFELTQKQVEKLEIIANKISRGASVFLLSEYLYLLIFIILFSFLIYFVAENKEGHFYTTIAFIIGSFTSILCGYIGMMISTSANYRTTYKA